MNLIDYALLICLVVLAAGLIDHAWLTWGRPIMTRRFGWRPVRSDEFMPIGGITVAALAAAAFFVALHIGAAAGF